MKLFALAEVVERLIMKNPSQYLWSAEVEGLPDELKRCNSPEKLLRSKLFEQSGDEGELKMLVNASVSLVKAYRGLGAVQVIRLPSWRAAFESL
ncbi:hypothetical protein PENARI_c004G08810 [Penicillium arizonense]|uniref:Uncharacterized protein n=1 Tax=Penicillium arizonense TaxID=1835702 RepID=A0A1F5LQP1_PENAI|nr:hypothetical protein PENARI_c004G08810 [Penicillium arizonense]OGE55447.1 hypothetical protein PENARI_c004G08810 [Penicillium arizonense]